MKRRWVKRFAVPQRSFVFDRLHLSREVVDDLVEVAPSIPRRLAPSGRTSASWKQKKGAPRRSNISKATSALSFASFIVSPNHGRSKVCPPKGSPPGQAKLCQ
jgi:hypothetical protein